MKQIVVSFLKENKGGVSLFVIMLVMEIIVTLTAIAVGAGQTARVVFSASAGMLTMIGIDIVGDMVGMNLSDTKRPAILAVITGSIIALI